MKLISSVCREETQISVLCNNIYSVFVFFDGSPSCAFIKSYKHQIVFSACYVFIIKALLITQMIIVTSQDLLIL